MTPTWDSFKAVSQSLRQPFLPHLSSIPSAHTMTTAPETWSAQIFKRHKSAQKAQMTILVCVSCARLRNVQRLNQRWQSYLQYSFYMGTWVSLSKQQIWSHRRRHDPLWHFTQRIVKSPRRVLVLMQLTGRQGLLRNGYPRRRKHFCFHANN